MSDQKKGLYGKYIVKKADTQEQVENCFVLKPDVDPAALKALKIYVEATSNHRLKKDLVDWIDACEKIFKGRRLKAIAEIDPPKCELCGEDMIKYAYMEDGWWLYWDCAKEDHIGHHLVDIDWSAIFHPNTKLDGSDLTALGFEVI